MIGGSDVNAAQAALWNDVAGRTWAELQQLLDDMLRPFETRLVEHAIASEAREVLDIGCGAGATTLALVRALGDRGVGVDISAPLIAAARARATTEHVPGVAFVEADAQVHPFEASRFDLVVSRFGVMFFDDPVAAFRNLRRAARDDAALAFVAWRSAAENPFMTAAERAASPFLPVLPPRDPNAPGQFAFGRRERIEAILAASGWADIAIAPADATCRLPAAAMMTYATRMGPLGLIFGDLDGELQEQIRTALRDAFAPFVRGDSVEFTAACWMVTARASA